MKNRTSKILLVTFILVVGSSFIFSKAASAASVYKYRCGRCAFNTSHSSYYIANNSAQRHANSTGHRVYAVYDGNNVGWCKLDF